MAGKDDIITEREATIKQLLPAEPVEAKRDATFKQLHTSKILRCAILSMLKLLAEGSPAEQQIVLGWLLDTSRLLVSLPSDKYSACTERTTIAEVVKEKGCTKGDLDTLKGQLNHAVYVTPLARHFLTHPWTARNSRSNKKARINLTTSPFLADLCLW